MKILLMFMIVVSLIMASSVASEETTPPGERINITADQLFSDRQKGFAKFSGNVKAVRGEAVLTSDHLDVYFSEKKSETDPQGQDEAAEAKSRIHKMVARGNVVFIYEDKTARAGEAEYLTDTEVVTLTKDNPVVTSKENTISGTKIVIRRQEDRVMVYGDAATRVEAEFYPEKKTD